MTPEQESALVEALAASEHERWARWQEYVFDRCMIGIDGALIPMSLFDRWARQIDTPYHKLSEAEKESDRQEARRTIEIMKRHL